MDEYEVLQAQLAACQAAQVPLRAQLKALEAEDRVLQAAMAALLSGIPVGAVFEIPKGRFRQGRWRVTGHRLFYGGEAKLIATKLKKSGTDSETTDVEIWSADWQRATFLPTEETVYHAD